MGGSYVATEWKTYCELVDEYEKNLKLVNNELAEAKKNFSIPSIIFFEEAKYNLINSIVHLRPYAEREKLIKNEGEKFGNTNVQKH